MKAISVQVLREALLIGVLALFASPFACHAANTVVAWGRNRWGITNVAADLTNVVAIAAGNGHSLALRSDGRVVVWGYDFYGQTNMPAELTTAAAIAAGYNHSLALKHDGTVVAWGAGTASTGAWERGQSVVPPGLTNVTAISGGAFHSLSLKSDGTVVAWGDSSDPATRVPTGLNHVVAISAGWGISLALKSDGTVVAWGVNGLTNMPADLTNVVAITAGTYQNLALKDEGDLASWGGFSYNPGAGSPKVAIAAGFDAYLALNANGRFDFWYYFDYFLNPGGPPEGLTNVVAIATKGDPADGMALIGDGPPVLTTPLSNPVFSRSVFKVSASTLNGRVYALEYKNSLTGSNWTALPLVAGTGGLVTLTDSSATGAQRFYRVRQW